MQAGRRREARRSQLVDAATSVFMSKGVSNTSVDDVVRAAGAAKGTFYLYFATKDDIVNAVAERLVGDVARRAERSIADANLSPVERLGQLVVALRGVGDEPYERELVEILHRPENRAVHDRISEHAMTRLAPMIADVIAEGTAAGAFRVRDPRHAAAYVMGALGGLHEVVSDPADLPAATDELNTFILRGLGYQGSIEQ